MWVNWKNVTINQFNDSLKIAKSTTNIVIVDKFNEDDLIYLNYSYLLIKKVKCYLAYYDSFLRKKKYVWCYIDTERAGKDLLGSQAFRIFSHYVDVDRIKLNPKDFGFHDISDIGHSKSFQFFNKKYNFTKQKAFEYDINSAFTSMAVLNPMPTKLIRTDDYLKDCKKEIGFTFEFGYLDIVDNNFERADYIFLLEEIKGFKEFFMNYYKRKLKAKKKGDIDEKNYCKNVMNYTIGYLQKVNPFIKAYIIITLNRKMFDLVDKFYDDVLLSNVDSLITKRDISEYLPISDNLGDFKKVKENEDFYMYNFNYQWNLEPPSYRGTSKAWFANYAKITNKKFDLSKTSVSVLNPLYNKYRFDKKTFQLVKEIN